MNKLDLLKDRIMFGITIGLILAFIVNLLSLFIMWIISNHFIWNQYQTRISISILIIGFIIGLINYEEDDE